MSSPFLLGEEIVSIEGYDWEIAIRGVSYGVLDRAEEIQTPRILKLRRLIVESGQSDDLLKPTPGDGAELMGSNNEPASNESVVSNNQTRDTEMLKYHKPTIVNETILHISSKSLGVTRENYKPWEKSLPGDAFNKIFDIIMDRYVLDPKVRSA